MPWLVTRYGKDITPGDGVLVWVSGKEAGIYAIAQVKESAQVLSKLPDQKYWTMPTVNIEALKARLGRSG